MAEAYIFTVSYGKMDCLDTSIINVYMHIAHILLAVVSFHVGQNYICR